MRVSRVGRRRARASVALSAAVIALVLSGCASDSLSEQYREGSGKNYIAGDGSVTEIALADRGKVIEFEGELLTGERLNSSELQGQVVVVNFWYAACAPCRYEAPDLQALWTKFQSDDVAFYGVNVRDQASTALSFEENYGITYPSFLDSNTADVQLAFAGVVAPNAVPTTIVLDSQHRVASRILGMIPDRSILDTLIQTALDEKQPEAPRG